ncbi:MAG: winged helix-turn-helix domain-containing protein [Geminicoccaceae bacterium]
MQAAAFGPFRLLPAQQLLLEGDRPVRLGGRALDILIALVERAGEVIPKDELVRRVWPDTFVEEGSLRVHVAALRRALGDGQNGNRYVANVPGRGYAFVGAIGPAEAASAAAAPAPPAADLPAPLARMIGRDEAVAGLVARLGRRRLVTVVGAGGIGKTAVALAVGSALAPDLADGVRFVDLAPVADPALVASALAPVLGVAVRSSDPLPGLLAYLRERSTLLVLDSCEHVVDAVAGLAEAILQHTAGVRILATSREPLRAEGESVVRLAPLALPEADPGITAAEALAFPAVQLFVERAATCLDDFTLTDAEAPVVVEICRRLDGIPLAIELAAGRLDAFGVRGLADRLHDRFALLTRGRRTARPRHRTLAATLDWSHGLLAADEQCLFRRLAVFAGWFTADAAVAVVNDGGPAGADVVGGIADLVAKSLVVADVEGRTPHYRLLESTRAYALEKLREAGETEAVQRRHAACFQALVERAEAEWESRPTAAWLADYARQIDNVRAALDWAAGPGGDCRIGVALTVAAVPLWLQLSLINECRHRVEQALAMLGPGAQGDDRLAMRLQSALGWSLMYTASPARERGAAWSVALALAERLGDTDYRLRSLWGLWAGHMNNGELDAALALAARFARIARESAEPSDRAVGDRMTGAVLHFRGDQLRARRHIERMLARYRRPLHRSHVVRFQFDQRVTAMITLMRALWLQGFADQALRLAAAAIDEAQALDHPLTLCNTLAQGSCPVALLAGDLAMAARHAELLQRQTERHAFDIWHHYAACYRGQILVRQGDVAAGLPLVAATVDALREARFVQHRSAFLIALAQARAAAGRTDEAMAVIEEALAEADRQDERWATAEMLRVRGDLRRQQGDDAAAAADYAESLGWARRQQALAWELRTATSLARLRRDQGEAARGRELLAPVLGRFTEGFGTADLVAARALLDGPG